MPVEAGTAEYSYVGNGSTVTFAFPSRFLTDDDIKVSLNGVEQSQSTYTVLGAGAANGGSIVFAVAPAAWVIVLLLRKPSPSQLIDFVNGQTVLEGTLDNALDRLTMVDQYALRTIDRTVRLADLDLTTDMQLPIRANRIGKVLGFGAVNGEPIALDPNDAQNNRIVNLGAPTALNDAARLQDVQTQAAANGNVPLPILAQVGYFLKATATGAFGWVAQTLGALAAKNTVAAADIDAGAVTADKIGAGAVSPAKLALGAWTTVASAATVDLGAQTSRNIVLSGTTGITSFGSTPTPDNVPFNVRSTGAIPITHSANLICPGAANLTLAAGDTFTVVQEATGVWRIVGFQFGTNPSNAIPVGTAANNLVRLDGSARLPAVSGANITNVTKLLASGTVSAVAQIDLVLSTYIAAGYTEFDLRISNLVAATNNTVLTLVVSTDGGATYQTSGYKGGGSTLLSGSTASFSVTGSGQSLNKLSVFDVIGNTTAKAATGVIRLFCKSQRFALVTESGSENPSSSEFITTKLFGWGDQTNVNAIRLQFATGNITSLTYSLIGVA